MYLYNENLVSFEFLKSVFVYIILYNHSSTQNLATYEHAEIYPLRATVPNNTILSCISLKY